MNLSAPTIVKYLKICTKIGWCNYDPKEEIRKLNLRFASMRNRRIIKLSLDDDYLGEYESIREAARQVKLKNHSYISLACSGKAQSAGDYKWIYKEDYEEYIANVRSVTV
jgi:hypothetical protein